ncbi:MAG: acetolactate synthase-1/2/3 large subunit, partial [Alphaproteobacteria bacterium]
MNGADVIAEILKREGTEFLACYPRNLVIESCAALGIRTVLCRQERVGVGMADGFSRIRHGKQNGVFAAQHGPGIENAFAGVAQAFAENVPMLVIPAGFSGSRQQIHPTFRAAEVYRPVTKWSACAHTVQELPEVMRRAYQAMRSGKGGPVLVEVPVNVLEGAFEGEINYKSVPIMRAGPDPDAIKDAVRLLLAAKNPVLWAGQGVIYAEAGERLLELAEMIP